MEYVEGKTTCVDCGSELVEELPDTPDLVSFLETEKEILAEKFVKFLKYSNIEHASYEFNDEKKLWIVLVEDKKIKQIKKLYNAFYSVEAEQILSTLNHNPSLDESNNFEELTDNEIDTGDDMVTDSDDESFDETIDEPHYNEFGSVENQRNSNSIFDDEDIHKIYESTQKKPEKPSAPYVKKEEQYRDLKSTAVTFFAVSALGIAVLILNVIGIIGIFQGIMPYIVMGSLFIGFIYVGITSLIKASKVEKEIDEENRVTESINNWLLANTSAEQLDSLINQEDSDEVRFFHKLEKLKEMVIKEFGELNDAYLDRLVEEFFNEHYEY
jgi:hypothetical protein